MRTIKNIIDKPGHINESLLEQVLGDLEVEYNKLLTYKVLLNRAINSSKPYRTTY
ncbi:MAG: hypothetical protein ABFS56_12935 [Pseudomonadota bacterium]